MDNTDYHRSHKQRPGIQAKPPQSDFSNQAVQLLARPYLVGMSSATMHMSFLCVDGTNTFTAFLKIFLAAIF